MGCQHPAISKGFKTQIETATPPLEHPPVLDDGEPPAKAGAQLGVPLGGKESGGQDRDDPVDSLVETITRTVGPTSGFRLRTRRQGPRPTLSRLWADCLTGSPDKGFGKVCHHVSVYL